MNIDFELKTNNIKKAVNEINKQSKYAAKFAIDRAANYSRDEMEEQAESKFNMQSRWASARMDTGYRARNARINGKTHDDLIDVPNHMTAGAYTGKEQTWAERQEKGGKTKSDTTPIYDSTGGKPNKARGGVNQKFAYTGGVREVFGKAGKKTSRRGLKAGLSKYGGKHGYRGKKIIKSSGANGTAYLLLNMKVKRANRVNSDADFRNGRLELLFFKHRKSLRTKRLTNFAEIHKANEVELIPQFSKRLRANIIKSGLKQQQLSVYYI